MATAISAADFVGTLGVNTHIDFANYGYQNLSVVEAAIKYLGLDNLRDSPQATSDANSWLQVSQATGAKFDAYIPEGSPSDMQNSLNLIPKLAQEGILNSIEGGNEEDDPYAVSLGNTLQIAADFQKNSVWPMGTNLGLPVINMSFGAGWTADNGWIGDYASVGDLAAYATYGNAHTYPMPGQTPDSTIQRINGLAKLADSRDQVITTEIGWDRNQGYSQQTVAKYVLDATMDGIKDGDVKMYFYALFDDGAGKFGLMNQSGTPMPAGTAIHNLTTLLSDTGPKFTAGSLNYSLANATSNDNSLLFEKSDGTYWISLWDEVDRAHNVTVKLPSPATDVKVFDPLTGTTATKDVKGASSVTVRLTDHPLLVEVTPSGSAPPPALQPNDLVINVPTSGDTVTANTTAALPGVSVTDPWAAQNPGLMALNLRDNSGAPLYVNGQQVTGPLSLTLDQLNADLASLSYKAGAPGNDTVTVDVWNQAGVEDTKSFGVNITAVLQPNDLVISVPTSGDTVTANTTSALPGVSVTDPWAAQNSGLMALNLWDNSGAPIYVNGQQVTGTLSVTLSQLNADLVGLAYKAGAAGSDTVFVNVWNQAGVQDTESFGVTIKAASSPTLNTVTAASTTVSPTDLQNNATITDSSSNHMIFIGGTNDPAILTGSTGSAQAAQRYNSTMVGDGDNNISFNRSGSVISTGSGPSMAEDTASANALVTPTEGLNDLIGAVTQSGHTIDFRPALKGIAGDGARWGLSDFPHISGGGSGTYMTGGPPALGATVGTMHSQYCGSLTMDGLLAYSMT